MASHPLNEYASEWRSRAWREGQTSGRLQYTRVPLLRELMLEIRESSPCRTIRVIHRVEPHGSRRGSCLDIAGLDGGLWAHAAPERVSKRHGETQPSLTATGRLIRSATMPGVAPPAISFHPCGARRR